MSKIFKSLFCAAVAAVPLSYVTFVHAVSALGDQEWRTLAVPVSEHGCSTGGHFLAP
jgi:hypothetical protein